MLNGFLGIGPTDTLYRPTFPNTSDAERALEMRVDALELACAGLWKLLKSQHGYTDDQLVQFIQTADAEDGKVDAKRSPVGQACPHCGRAALTRQRFKCLWCGAPLPHSPL